MPAQPAVSDRLLQESLIWERASLRVNGDVVLVAHLRADADPPLQFVEQGDSGRPLLRLISATTYTNTFVSTNASITVG